MAKRRDPIKDQQMWQAWHGKPPAVAVEQGQMGITGDAETTKTKRKSKVQPPPPHDAITWEEALEDFLNSSCFMTCICDATKDKYGVLQLHPHRLPCGYFWKINEAAFPAPPYETIELQLPTLPEFVYKILMKKHNNSHWAVGPIYKKSDEFNSYKDRLREALRQVLTEQSA